jgi:hypothetical protein
VLIGGGGSGGGFEEGEVGWGAEDGEVVKATKLRSDIVVVAGWLYKKNSILKSYCF